MFKSGWKNLVLAMMVIWPVCASAQTAGGVLIVNSGSTNLPGYRIELLENGTMVYTDGAEVRNGTVSAALTQKFFGDIKAATPFAQLALQPCMKSASFGSRTMLVYGNDKSPDISCPGNPKATTLYGDVQAILQVSGISILPRRQFPLPFAPRKAN